MANEQALDVIFEVTSKQERKGGAVNIIFAPEDPREQDEIREVDHPNRKVWPDRHRKPTGSLSLVVPEEVASGWAIGDRVRLRELMD